jgi:hypothetical protein
VRELRDLLNAAPTRSLRGVRLLLKEILQERERKNDGHAYDWYSMSSEEIERACEAIEGTVRERRD